jgi:CcmD family protein
MSTAEKYVTAAYLVIFLAVLVYVVVIAAKLARLEREVAELADRVRARQAGESARREEEVGV